MSATTSRELLLYELGIVRDTERSGRDMLALIRGGVQNPDLAQALLLVEQQAEQHYSKLKLCFESLGAAPLETPCEIVKGIRSRYESFTRFGPSPRVLELFAMNTVRQFVTFNIGAYTALVNLSLLMGEMRSAQCLLNNLIEKDELFHTLQRVGHQLVEQILAVVPSS